MKTFIEYQEEKDFKEINEGVLDVAGAALGYGVSGLVVGYGGLLLIKGYDKLFRGGKKTFDKIKGRKAVAEAKLNPIVKKIETDLEKTEKQYKEDLAELFSAILSKNSLNAKKAFDELPTKISQDKKVKTLIIMKISDVMGPPEHSGPTGNESYKFIKKVLGLPHAKAAAMATDAYLKKIGGGIFKDGE